MKKLCRDSIMKRFLILALALIVCAFADRVHAANLSTASIRMDRQAVSVNPGNILITARTGENVTENGVQVVAGSSWAISGLASTFTVSTANLPSGVTAWPGIGTASNVSGNTISFPSSDISAGTTYGFYITGGIPVNPSSASVDGKVWQISTLVGGNPSSNSSVGVNLQSNDQLTVSGQVLPPASAFEVAIESLATGTTFPQGQEIQYQITYGSTHNSSSHLQLQAEWSLGTIDGASSPSVDILEYVVGSASNAYGGAAPVVDVVNRTITWNISNFPANTTSETVTFSLKTKAGYTGRELVDFDVIGRILQPVVIPDDIVTLQYQYVAPPTPPPTNAGSSGESTSNPPTATAVPGVEGPSTEPLTISSVNFDTIGPTSTTVSVKTNQISDVTIQYGRSPDNVNQQTLSSVRQSSHQLTLANLEPQTQYYFKIVARNGASIVESEVFTFTTSVKESDVKIDQFSLTANGIALFSASVDPTNLRTVPIPYISAYEISIRLQTPVTFSKASIVARDKHANTIFFESALVETQPGLWSVQIPASFISSQYSLVFTYQTIENNLANLPLIYINTISPLTLRDQVLGTPVERAQVEVFQYNPTTQLYQFISGNSILKNNPLYSDYSGVVPVVLPLGKYKIKITSPLHEYLEYDFEITDQTLALPQIHLQPTGVNVINMINYYKDTVTHFLEKGYSFIGEVTKSQSFVAIANSSTLTILSIVSVIAFSAKTHLMIWQLPQFLQKVLSPLLGFKSATSSLLQGRVIDKISRTLISRASIQFIDPATQQVISQLHNYKNGLFQEHLPNKELRYIVTAEGYLPFEGILLPRKEKEKSQSLVIELQKQENISKRILKTVWEILEHIVGTFFEAFLLFAFIAQFLFIPHLGVKAVLPFLLISVLNFGIWILFSMTDKRSGL